MLSRVTPKWRFIFKSTFFSFLEVALFVIVVFTSNVAAGPPRYSSRIVETQSGAIRGIILELNSKYLEPVEVFRGVPYAAPPVGPYRFRAPQPPLSWPGTRLADSFGPVCPQNYPDITNRSAALLEMPKGRYNYLKKLLPLFEKQSENCLFLNIYVPGSGNRGFEAPYAVLVLIHGESFEWGGSHPYDGSVMASHGHVIFITLNYRLGVLGFLKTSTDSTVAESESFGIQDIAAALRWIKLNIAAFGGDSTRVTLIGEGTGATLVNLLLLSTKSKGLFRRVILLSGTALSPWGTVHNPDLLRVTVGKQMGCLPQTVQEDNLEDVAACLRSRPLKAILDLKLEKVRFMPRIAPWTSIDPHLAMERTSNTFITSEIMLGVATTECYADFNSNDIQYGFEEDQRNRILRTYVRNTYVYHLNEIFSAVRNEYTDWDKPIPHPINLRDSVIEALSDGHTVAPAIRVAYLHARRGARTYFFHFGYQSKDSDYPQRLGSVRGEPLAYLLGQPLVEGMPNFPQNYSKQDMGLSEALLIFISNFAKTGDPNQPGFHKEVPDYGTPMEKTRYRGLVWDPYETGTQYYLSLTQKPKMRSHYRGHKMAVWLNLIPQLHQPGDDEVSMRHHHFSERESHYYAGVIRSESYAKPPARIYPGSMTGFRIVAPKSKTTTECLSTGNLANSILEVVGGDVTITESESTQNLKTSNYWYGYPMLGLCLIVGFVLVLLNIIAFTGIYFQISFEKRKDKRRATSNATLNHPLNPIESPVNEERRDFEEVPSSYHILNVTSPLNKKTTPQSRKSSNARKKMVQIQEVPLQSFTFEMQCNSQQYPGHTILDDGKSGDETMTLDLVSVRL